MPAHCSSHYDQAFSERSLSGLLKSRCLRKLLLFSDLNMEEIKLCVFN